jgi:hypothetical protein
MAKPFGFGTCGWSLISIIEKNGVKTMAGRKPEAVRDEPSRTLTDDQIITERKHPRRSFLTAAGTLLAGGAAVLVAGKDPAAQDKKDPDQEKKADDDQKKETTSSKGKKKTQKSDKKTADPDKGKD